MKKFVLLIVFLFVTLAAPAGEIKPYSAEYSVSAFGLTVGKAVRSLNIDTQGFYDLKMHTWSTTFLYKMDILQNSHGLWQNNRPLIFNDINQHDKNTQETNIVFDWDNLIATSHYKFFAD